MARILCIEDDSEMSQLMSMILTRLGHEVGLALNGTSGLQMVSSFQPELILLDLMMPDLDGWEVYRQLKAQDETRAIPVIVVTARAQQAERTMARQLAQVEDYITKPFTPPQLVASVERILEKYVSQKS